MRSLVEIHLDGQWRPAAEFDSKGDYRATFEYLPEYVFGEHPHPVSLSLPVSMDRFGIDAETGAPHCPAFLLDLVPQGRGRTFLLQELKIGGDDGNDLLLAQYGAFNPIAMPPTDRHASRAPAKDRGPWINAANTSTRMPNANCARSSTPTSKAVD